jgi:hypothetical protein
MMFIYCTPKFVTPNPIRQHTTGSYFSFYFIKYIHILNTSVIKTVDHVVSYAILAGQVTSDNTQTELCISSDYNLLLQAETLPGFFYCKPHNTMFNINQMSSFKMKYVDNINSALCFSFMHLLHVTYIKMMVTTGRENPMENILYLLK